MQDAARDSRARVRALTILDAEFVADPAGALFWPGKRLLAVADLHLEKGSAFAARGVFLPPYDTVATLCALETLIESYRPRAVVALGDSFHDAGALDRIRLEDRRRIGALQRGRDWIWITGNHDPDPPAGLDGEAYSVLRVGAVVFRHEPSKEPAPGEIAGHLHPAAKVAGRAGCVRRRSFLSDGERCVMPAFGAFAGGLNVRDAVFAAMFGAHAGTPRLLAHVIGRGAVYAVPHAMCLSD